MKISLLLLLISFTASAYAGEAPKTRIISLAPATTEILFALDLKDEIIGVSSYCDWPLEVSRKERVGSFSNPNIEKIILLKPDLIVLASTEQSYLKPILDSLKIEHVVIDPNTIEGLLKDIKEIGRITDREKKAAELIGSLQRTVRGLKEKRAGLDNDKRVKVYFEIWHDPIMTAGKGSFIDDMIEKAGGENIAHSLNRSYSKIDPEMVISSDPDIIIVSYMKPEGSLNESFKNRIGWNQIKAVKNNRIYSDIRPDIILRPGPRAVDGLKELYEKFYEQ